MKKTLSYQFYLTWDCLCIRVTAKVYSDPRYLLPSWYIWCSYMVPGFLVVNPQMEHKIGSPSPCFHMCCWYFNLVFSFSGHFGHWIISASVITVHGKCNVLYYIKWKKVRSVPGLEILKIKLLPQKRLSKTYLFAASSCKKLYSQKPEIKNDCNDCFPPPET